MTLTSAVRSGSSTQIIAIVNQKGGVGKTTTCVNLATALAAVGRRVLVVDCDGQGNASTGFGVPPSLRMRGTYDVLFDGAQLDAVTVKTAVPNLFVVPATVALSGAEIELVQVENREFRLREALRQVGPLPYDYIFIDCPPSLGLVTLNALVAADQLLVPLQCEFYALEGLSLLTQTVERIRGRLNPPLRISGIVLTMMDKRNALALAVERDVRDHFGGIVYNTTIPRNVRVSEAPSHGKPVLLYDLKCPGARAYCDLAAEMLKRNREVKAA